jgi:predicted membrane-bound mannosyltransferase
LLVAAVAIGSAHLGWQAWRASVVYASDPRNPYVYSQTVPDAVRLAARIRDLAAVQGEPERMPVTVIAPPDEQWPLPWYLRTMTHVGYWMDVTDAPDLKAPVIVSSTGHVEMLDAALGDRYVSEFFGLRPNVLLTLYVERGLWDRFLSPPDKSGPVR